MKNTKLKSTIFACAMFAAGMQLTAQTPWYIGGNPATGINKFGTTSTGDIQFITNGSNMLYMKESNGFMGFGTTTSPAWLIDAATDINVGTSSAAYGYRINDTMALLLPNPSTGYGYNTFVGRAALSATNPGTINTVVGYGGGGSLTTLTSAGTYIGAFTGQNNTGHYPTFIGAYAGQANTGGDGNVFVGYKSGVANLTGGSNTFVGANTGGTNTTGSSITLLGISANVGSSNLTDAAAIGSGAVVNTSNTMILGDNNTSVGIDRL
jgi:hypothetical protein